MNRDRIRRAAGLVLLLGYTLGTLLGTAHLALVEHTVCADHGEVTHGATACADAPAVLDACAEDAEGEDGPRVAAAAETDGAHEHCATELALRADLRFEAGPCVARAAPPVLVRTAPFRGRLRVRDDVLELAPKQSPPAHARAHGTARDPFPA